jgi:hypothetical protein
MPATWMRILFYTLLAVGWFIMVAGIVVVACMFIRF